MAFVLPLPLPPLTGRKVLAFQWPPKARRPPQALGEQPLGMPVAFLKNRRSRYGEEWEQRGVSFKHNYKKIVYLHKEQQCYKQQKILTINIIKQ